MKVYGLALLVAAWVLVVGSGIKLLADHQNAPGQNARARLDWPHQSGIARSRTAPTLVMLAHPQCPCTRSSLTELARIMARCKNKLVARVIFFKPKAMSEQWLHSDLWKSAAAIPGVQVEDDTNGAIARKFGAKTSGQVLLYDSGGKLVFSGGITSSRGHEGDNEGSAAITAFVLDGSAKVQSTPVFGCALITPSTTAGTLR